eukprot:s1851_g13.t1
MDTVRTCLKDPTRTFAANEIFAKDRPKLATSTTKQVKDTFIQAVKTLHPSIPEYKIQHLINVFGASYLLEEIDLDSMFTVDLINTNKTALVVPLREGEIPRWNLVDLLDRAVKRGKGQQEILLALQYKGAGEHLALKAGGNDMVQLKCASHGVVTSAEKYTVARSEHCTIKYVVVAWDDLTFIRNRHNQSRSCDSTDPKDGSKDAKEERPPDPDNRRVRSWETDYGDDDDA